MLNHHCVHQNSPLFPPDLCLSLISVMAMSFEAALHISYTVKPAIDTAVMASISTPVLPVDAASPSIVTLKSSRFNLKSTCTCERFMLWHNGIRLLVCFAAVMPAIFATESTSPFPIWLAKTKSNTFFPRITLQTAMAFLLLLSFWDTSTIWASPDLPVWVNSKELSPMLGDDSWISLFKLLAELASPFAGGPPNTDSISWNEISNIYVYCWSKTFIVDIHQ